jgi:LysM repeat protein
VRNGDTPLAIALSHNISLQELYRANNLSDDAFLQIGQVLTIPGGTGESTSETDTSDNANSATEPTQQSYTVRSGDTVFAIAIRLGVDWQEMLSANNLTEQSLLQPGQTLVVP